jgi:hypothetical protein
MMMHILLVELKEIKKQNNNQKNKDRFGILRFIT